MSTVRVSITTQQQVQPPPVVNVPLLDLEKYTEWQKTILATRSDIFRVRKWGDPVMVKEGGLSTALIGGSNFQAVGLYNKATGFGGVSNWLKIESGDVRRLAAMQLEDNYQDKQSGWNQTFNMEAWRAQKMNWLAKPKGTIYFWYHSFSSGNWYTLPHIEWGTIALGWNLVRVVGVETLKVKTPDGVIRTREMARLAGFQRSDWGRPLVDLLAEGVVHRCFSAYLGDDIGDSPKGICYSPFFSPQGWDMGGAAQPAAFYLPVTWLIKE